MGPVLIFDKSFLQSLNPDEAVWLDQFFLSNITPVFFIETLADLEKEVRKGRTPEEIVGNLAHKTPDFDSRPNVHHQTLLAGELSGRGPVVMDGRPLVSGGKYTELADRTGVIFEQAPEEAALNRWQRGEFLYLERQQAKIWRRGLASTASDLQRQTFANWFGDKKPSNLTEVKLAADTFIDGNTVERSLVLGMMLLGVRPERQTDVLERWKRAGSPALSTFAPYFRHAYGVELFFYLGLAANLISTRPTNKVDIAYLYYLPFCMVFTSNDRLHAATIPLFLRSDQAFVPGTELKTDLGALDRHYDTLPDTTKAQGLHHFASRPPESTVFLVVRLWDRYMRAGWRDDRGANAGQEESDPSELAAWIRREVEAMRKAPGAPVRSSDDVNRLIITRKVSMKKGKWKRFPVRG